MRTDVVLLVPFQPSTGTLLDAAVRRTAIAGINLPILEARAELEAELGRSLEPPSERWRGTATRTAAARQVHRSAAAVVLATHLERAGLSWEVIDPGARELGYWRRALEKTRVQSPRSVAICTTFIVSAPWLRLLCRTVRRVLPEAKLLVGGYYYATNARAFLSLDADVFCVGEGELRLPEIVRAIRNDEPAELDRIAGLYLRRPDGKLHFTGVADPITLETLAAPDWRLAERMHPPAEIKRDAMVYVGETQRGCVFKCEYCTYRTLAELKLMSAARAADLLTGLVPIDAAPGSQLDIVDATATYPRDRWQDVMRLLAARGGSRVPISAYARLSDISETAAEWMAKAGVRRLFIGQESGDQEMLNRMKKGTRVTHVRPAIDALWRHRIDPLLSFIHGFPGETRESLAQTRRMIRSLNDGWPDEPACTLYRIEPFSVYDFATVSRAPEMKGATHYLGYATSGKLDVHEVMREVLITVVEMSRVGHAPVCESLLDWMRFPTGWLKERFLGAERENTFRWLKAVERGVAIFLERHLFAEKPDRNELDEVLDQIRHGLAEPALTRSLAVRMRARATASAARRLRRETEREAERGIGPLTRAVLMALLSDTLDLEAIIGLERPPSDDESAGLAQALVNGALRPRRPDVLALRAGRV